MFVVEVWLPRSNVIKLPAIGAQMLFDVVHRKGPLLEVLMVGVGKSSKPLSFLGLMALLQSLIRWKTFVCGFRTS